MIIFLYYGQVIVHDTSFDEIFLAEISNKSSQLLWIWLTGVRFNKTDVATESHKIDWHRLDKIWLTTATKQWRGHSGDYPAP